MNLDRKIILYVDDDEDDRELLAEVMKRVAPGLQVTFAEHGLQAMEILQLENSKRHLPNLIVLDLNMPYLDGRQTFERIKADPMLQHIPLVILSSGENPADIASFVKIGIPYFTKPVEYSMVESQANQIVKLCS